MFSFYGSKSKIVKKYPKPRYNKIVEGFAGSARYSLEYWENDITLIEKDTKIYTIWKYLQRTTKERILSLPNISNATNLLSLPEWNCLELGEKYLLGFCSNGGSASPKTTSGRHNFNSWNKDKIRIADTLYKIKHWKIIHGDFLELEFPDIATYYIDPPYQNKGKWYKENKIDYDKLGSICKNLQGQVIVCESLGANWLPFVPLVDIPFTHYKTEEDKIRKTTEVIWTNDYN